MGCAEAVGAGVSAAQDDHALALRADALIRRDARARVEAVLLRQEIHSEMHAAKLAPRHRQIARHRAAARQNHRVEVAHKIRGGVVRAHVHARLEYNAFVAHLLNAALHNRLFQLEIGDAQGEQPADILVALKHRDPVAAAVELLRGG